MTDTTLKDRAMEQRLTTLEQGFARMEKSVETSTRETNAQLRDIAQSLQMLVRMDERMQHINVRLNEGSKSMEEMRERLTEIENSLPKRADSRIAELERDMPPLKETRHDIRRLNWLVVSAIAAAVLGLVVTGAFK